MIEKVFILLPQITANMISFVSLLGSEFKEHTPIQ